jgi:hypothetical protein
MKNLHAEIALRSWLTENGLSAEHFEDTDLHLLQAQRIAHNLLKHYPKLLDYNQTASLNNFLRAMSGSQRKKLKLAHAQKVMNIGTTINRKLFKQYRELQRQIKQGR